MPHVTTHTETVTVDEGWGTMAWGAGWGGEHSTATVTVGQIVNRRDRQTVSRRRLRQRERVR